MLGAYSIIEINILQLLESDERWWTLSEITHELYISKATAQKYINLIKKQIQYFDKSEIFLESVTNRGVRLYRAPHINIKLLYSQILKKQLAFSLIDSSLRFTECSVTKLALDNFTSVATIRRKYTEINGVLESIGLSLKNNTLRGKEEQIRWFYAEYYWFVFKGIEWPFSSVSRSNIIYMINKIEKETQSVLPVEMKERLSYWIAVHKMRYSKGFRLSLNDEITNYCAHNNLFEGFVKIVQESSSQVQSNCLVMHEETKILFYVYCALVEIEKNVEFVDQARFIHKTTGTKAYMVTMEWLKLLCNFFGGCDAPADEITNKALYIHSVAQLYIINEKIFLKTAYEQEIATRYPNFFYKVEQMYSELALRYPHISENKAYLIERYTVLAIEYLSLSTVSPVVRIALNFTDGQLYNLAARKKLNHYFKGQYKFQFVTPYAENDILITDLPRQDSQDIQSIVCTNSHFSSRDYHNIEQRLLKITNRIETKYGRN